MTGVFASHRERFEEGVFGVEVVVDGDFGGEVVWEVVELAAAADGHEDGGGSFFDGEFDHGDRAVDGFDGAAEVEAAGDDGAAFEAFVEEGGAEGEEDADAGTGSGFGTVEGAELDGELVGAWVAVADEVLGSAV